MNSINAAITALFAASLVAAAALAQQRPEGPGPGERADRSAPAAERGDSTGDSARRGARNAGLTGKVKAALAGDVGLKTLRIDVDSNEGVVTLKGAVDSEDTRKRAEQVAKQVDGVKQVRNELRVRGS